MRFHITINLLVYLIVIPWVAVQVLGDESDSAACSKLIVNACQGTKMEDYASGIFVPFNGYCEGSPSYSKYKKKNGDPVYIFYKPASAKWYISHTGGFASTCGTNLFNIDAVIFDAANEPYKETGDDDGEAKCNNGLDNDTNRQSFQWRPITIECADGNSGGNGPGTGGDNYSDYQCSQGGCDLSSCTVSKIIMEVEVIVMHYFYFIKRKSNHFASSFL